METKSEVFQMYVNDMIALERHILEAIERQAGDGDVQKFPEATRLIGQIESTMRQHVQALEQYMGAEGGMDESAIKKAVSTVLGFVAGMYDKVRQDTVSRMLRDDYTALSHAAVSYHMLLTTALAWNDQRLADLAERHLRDLTPIIVDISREICRVVAKELAQEGRAPNPQAADEAVRRSHQPWSSRFVSANL